MPFTKTGTNTYKSPSGRTFTKKQVKMYYATDGFTKKKHKISVNNKLKGALGEMNPRTNRIQINVKKHKGDLAELSSTIKHELLHVKHPKMTEKEVYKRSRKTKMSYSEQQKYLAKLNMKKINYKGGAVKRKLGIKVKDKTEPGSFISKANEINRMNPTKKTAFMGLI